MKKTFLILAIIAFAACESSEEQVVSEIDRASLPSVNGEFLAAVKPAANSTISFWELEPGLLFVYVDAGISDNLSEADAKKIINTERSVVDIYKHFANGQINETYVRALQEAQIRKESLEDDDNVSESEIPASMIDATTRLKNESGRTALIPRSDCQPDHYQDAYGDRWFVGEFTRVFGPITSGGTNEYEYTKILNTRNVQYGAMAADFAATAVVRTYRMNSSLTQWIKDYEVTLQPRTLAWPFYIASKKQWYLFEVLGNAPCPRIHAAYKIM